MRSTRFDPRKSYRRQAQSKALRTMLLCAVLLTGCSSLNSAPADNGQAVETAPLTVKTEELRRQIIGEPEEVTASVLPSEELNLIASIGGKVEKVEKRQGDMVKEGGVIARLSLLEEDKELRQSAEEAVLEAQQQIEEAKKQISLANVENETSIQKLNNQIKEALKVYNKVRNDYDVGMATQDDLNEARAAYDNLKLDLSITIQRMNASKPEEQLKSLEEQLENAKETVEQLKQQEEQLVIKAPINGVLTQLSLSEGITIRSDEAIGNITKLDPVILQAMLTEKSLPVVSGKESLPVIVPTTSQTFQGQIRYLATLRDPNTNAYELDLEVPNPDIALQPGMKVKVRLTDEAELNVLAVPVASILTEGADSYVFVISNGVAEKRKVNLGLSNGFVQEIVEGVAEGEWVALTGIQQLKDKEKVRSVPQGGSN
ncbi:efflux RND transporter periplasmic adaptor subunit [Cohnella lubricantis]|uniref:Efflux RND transporter periplasmic adaptor subunit n=1 Tax=Cohnella lubricantis TaxID=2163172 RepID=A0A841T5M3_9BACL|nr:efflux RND transporter periplasmic adaptor subunit [Cohnella lubricantis]MBB6676833.1 efflux RND transporter periplasmic adaptor subunit [Cohnella lubricantis]MBP2119413.1 RND family efflux transporter MFP subunit [Cohnella lubricantis]